MHGHVFTGVYKRGTRAGTEPGRASLCPNPSRPAEGKFDIFRRRAILIPRLCISSEPSPRRDSAPAGSGAVLFPAPDQDTGALFLQFPFPAAGDGCDVFQLALAVFGYKPGVGGLTQGQRLDVAPPQFHAAGEFIPIGHQPDLERLFDDFRDQRHKRRAVRLQMLTQGGRRDAHRQAVRPGEGPARAAQHLAYRLQYACTVFLCGTGRCHGLVQGHIRRALVVGVIPRCNDRFPLRFFRPGGDAPGLAHVIGPFLRHVAREGGRVLADMPALGLDPGVADAHSGAESAPAVGWVVRDPEGMADGQDQVVPLGMLQSPARPLDLLIQEIGAGLALVPELLPAPSHVAGAHVGVDDDRAAPAGFASVLPAVGRHDLVEILAELGRTCATVHVFLDGGLEVGQQRVVVGPGDHKCLGVAFPGKISVGLDRQADFTAEMVGGLGEGRVFGSDGDAGHSLFLARPAGQVRREQRAGKHVGQIIHAIESVQRQQALGEIGQALALLHRRVQLRADGVNHGALRGVGQRLHLIRQILAILARRGLGKIRGSDVLHTRCPPLPAVAVAAFYFFVGQLQSEGRRVLIALGLGLDLGRIFHFPPDLGRFCAGEIPLRQPGGRADIKGLTEQVRVRLDHAGRNAAVHLCRAAILTDARGAGLGKYDLGNSIVPIRQEIREIPAALAGGLHQGDVKARGHGHRPLAAQGQGRLQGRAFTLVVFGVGIRLLIGGLGGGHAEAVQVGGPEARAVALEVDRPPEHVPQTYAIRAVVILRTPGGQPEFARRHGAVLSLDYELELAILAVTKPPGRAHLDIREDDTVAVAAPETLRHAVAVEHSAVHLAADLVKLDGVEVIPQKVRRRLVARVLPARHHLPFRFHQLVLALLHERGHLVVPT
nr:MAG TPA: hypothetical protein [Caudoviricetes sp.]